MSGGGRRKTLGDLRQELGQIEGRRQVLVERFEELCAPARRGHLDASAAVSFIGLVLSVGSGGAFGLLVASLSSAYGVASVVQRSLERWKIEQSLRELEHDFAIKANTIAEVRKAARNRSNLS